MASIAIAAGISKHLSQPRLEFIHYGLPFQQHTQSLFDFKNPLIGPPQEGQRLGDLQIQDTVEGSGENRCFGPKNRVAGTLVWMSDLREVKKTESGGGKAGGGAGGEFITYQYYAHVMISLCRARVPISRVPKIWSDGKLFFNLDTDVNFSSTGIDAKVSSSTVFGGFLGGQQTSYVRNYLVLESDINGTAPSGRPDLSTLKSGGQVTVGGYAAPSLLNMLLTATPTLAAAGSGTVALKTSSGTTTLNLDDVLEFAGWSGSYSVRNTSAVNVTTAGVTVQVQNAIIADRPNGSATAPTAVIGKHTGTSQVNNGTFTVSAATKDPDPSGTQVSQVRLTDQSNPFRKFFAVGINIVTTTLFQTNSDFKASQVGQVFILTGGPDQAIPQILQQIEAPKQNIAATQIYAMRNRAGFILQDVNLTDSGNRVANYEGQPEVTADPQLVSDVIKTLLTDDAGWPEAGIDVSLVSASSLVLGYTVKGPTPPRRSLAPLMLVHDVVQWETAGKLFFATRSSLPTLTIPPSDVGAYDPENRGGKRQFGVKDPSREFMPSEVVVSYRSSSHDFATATRRSMRVEEVPPNPRPANLQDMVLDDDQAQQLADGLMASAWGASRKLNFSLPQSYAGIVRAGMMLNIGGYALSSHPTSPGTGTYVLTISVGGVAQAIAALNVTADQTAIQAAIEAVFGAGAASVKMDGLLSQAGKTVTISWTGALGRQNVSASINAAGVTGNAPALAPVTIYGQQWRCLTTQVDRGANMLLQVEAQEYDPNLLLQSATTEGTLGFSATGNTQDGGHTLQAPAELFLLDTPALTDQHRGEPGVYLAARNADPARPWRGAILYWSIDAGVRWDRVLEVPVEAMTGEVVTPPAVSILPGLWDRANTIRVVIRHPQVQLGSVSEDACVAGSNRFLIGREIVGAANVAYVSYDSVEMTKTYDLSTLLRGQQDTDQEMNAHAAGEAVVWLDGPGVQYLPLSYSHVDNARLWKLVPHGGFIEDSEAIQFTPGARAARPYHVRDVKATRDGSYNITCSFQRSTKAARTLFEHGEPLDEEYEAYEIDVVRAGVVRRTIKIDGTRTFYYPAAQQVSDGYTPGPGPAVTVKIYQMSAGLLRGAESEYLI